MTDPDTSPAPDDDSDVAAAGAAARDNDELDDGLSSADYSVAFSPRQVVVGLAIMAGLVAVVAARRRGRRRSDGDA